MSSKIHISFFYFLLSVLLLLFQSFQFISVGSIYPDFVLLLTIIYALSRGPFKGEIFGFGMGLLLDLMSGALFGLNAFIFTLVGSCASLFQRIAKLPNIIVFTFYIIIVTTIKYILYHIFFAIFQSTNLFDFYFFLKIPGEIIINIIVGLVIYIVCARFDVRDDYEWFQ